MTTSRDSLDRLVEKLCERDKSLNEAEVKQAIHQWALDEVIGTDMPMNMDLMRTTDQTIRDTCYTQGVNETKAKQRAKLKGDIDDK